MLEVKNIPNRRVRPALARLSTGYGSMLSVARSLAPVRVEGALGRPDSDEGWFLDLNGEKT